jgi:hypothetical protein
MPNQKIAVTPVDNGDEKHDNVLTIQWGAFGDAPDAPEGWVNQGYAMLHVDQEPGDEERSTHYVVLSPADMDHLIRTLKNIRRKTFDKR